MPISAHEIAKKLLAGPDVPVRFQDSESAYSGYIKGVDESTGQFCECDDFAEEDPELDEDDQVETSWDTCVTLEVGSTDGILTGDSIIEH